MLSHARMRSVPSENLRLSGVRVVPTEFHRREKAVVAVLPAVECRPHPMLRESVPGRARSGHRPHSGPRLQAWLGVSFLLHAPGSEGAGRTRVRPPGFALSDDHGGGSCAQRARDADRHRGCRKLRPARRPALPRGRRRWRAPGCAALRAPPAEPRAGQAPR